MRKPYKHNELSDIKCSNSNCNNFIKKNIAERKTNKPKLCFKCYAKENDITTAREVRTGKKPKKKIKVYNKETKKVTRIG